MQAQAAKTKGKDSSPSSYRLLASREKVLIKVPNPGPYFTFVQGHSFQSANGPVSVKSHWRQGMPMPGGVILNRHFFGIDISDHRNTISATVEVVLKTTGDGREFVMMNVTKTGPAAQAQQELKIYNDGMRESADILIAGTSYVHFRPIKK